MGQGLGKNSPVVLSLGRENYEALLSRHGQFVRWRIGNKCNCIDKRTFQPNIHCKKCGGRGIVYDCQKNAEVIQIVMATSNVLEVDSEYENCQLIKVYDMKGNFYNAEKNGTFIFIENDNIVKGEYYNIVMNKSLVLTLDKAECESIGYNYFRIKNLSVRRNGIEGIFYSTPCDIIEIGKVIDNNNVEYEVKELRQDNFYIEPIEQEKINQETQEVEKEILQISLPLRVENIKYMQPNVFAVLNQNLNKSEADMIVEAHGDAIVTFPYCYDVAENDVITVLSGTYIKKEVVNRTSADFDVLNAFFVEKIIRCIGKRVFFQGKDFLLVGVNSIKWICEDAPEVQETYSITFSAYPTYSVVKSIPQLRTSEDQRMPKKAIVQFFNSYAEQMKINRQ